MVLYLGIDGGGTGCRAALADRNGQVLGLGTGGPANINTDVEAAAGNIVAAATQALAASGSGAGPADLVAVLGLAGGTMRAATDRLAAILPFARIRIVNDGITAARGALGSDDGILAAMGTGSVFAVQRGGELRQVGGRGFLMGDEGSGAVLGRSLLSQAMRAADGFHPMSPLLAVILEEFGGTEGIIGFGNTARPADFARLAPRIVASDDPAARAILDAAVAGLRAAIATLQDGDSLPVVFTGGLGPHYAARLAGDWPQRPARGSSVDGALAMAMETGALESGSPETGAPETGAPE
ncbi:BadF/BadG/BcrA/BcrD ATPase family protein [Paracoccus spongiarum]|uniref:BadF/BadG/BcrA/BcrD ATPase family protein n=1 Tax=Paracoccus spongiarum TaxID=3064387 RepID=A0ABT9JED5_9RHOB|nr:BadF/BadG/BcrA/BcrD ATPase family protein [Paracoccus sp. 2205BS29-5]MDP5308187.1 BadF/BadG/BcrA/BcrD ATPase family protein [Paracoccus sp. 2205BS29-5]